MLVDGEKIFKNDKNKDMAMNIYHKNLYIKANSKMEKEMALAKWKI